MAGGNEKELKLIISAYDKGLKAGLKDAQIGLKKTGTEAGKSQKKFKSLRAEASQLTGHLKNLVGAYVGFRAVEGVVGTISDFNTEMAKTSTMADTSSAAWDGLSDKIIGISTRVPQSAAELAAAEYDILSANVALEDSAVVLEQAARAAVAGITDTQTAAKVGTSVINAYGLDIDKLDGVYDDLFTTVKLGKTEFPLLAASIGKVLPTARAAKVDLKELGAHLATLTQGGLSTAESTTALRGAMIGLQTPTEAAKKKMAELGIEWNGLTGTIKQIVDLNLGAEVMREIIPETEARSAVLTLAQNFGKLEENLTKMKDTAGATDAAYAKMAETIENQFKQIRNSLTAGIIDSDKFKESLDNLLVSAEQSKEGLAGLATVVLDLSAKLVNGAANIGTFLDATNQLLDQATLQIEVQGQQAEVMDTLAAKIKAANEATGLQISTSKELVALISAGVIVFDELSGKVLVNAENLKLYNQGLLLIGPAVDLAAGSQAALWEAAGKVNDALVQQKSDMAGVADEIEVLIGADEKLIESKKELSKSYALTLADLKIALAEGKITQDKYNTQMLAAEKKHLTEMVATRKAAVKEIADAGKTGTKEYEEAILKLRDAELKLIKVEQQLQGEVKTTAGKLKSAADAWKKVGDYARETRKKLSDAGDKMKEAGDKGKEGADTGKTAWGSFADQVGITLEQLKAAIAEVVSGISDAKTELTGLERWREQSQRTEFHASAAAKVDAVKNADPFAIQRVIDQQNDILRSQSEWLGTDDKAEARWIIEQLQKALLGIDWRDEENTSTTAENTKALDANTKAVEGFYDIVSSKDYYGVPGMSDGGPVFGIGSGDTVRTLLTPGEFVIKKSIVDALGVDFFAALNGGFRIPQIKLPTQRFATGGQVQEPAKTVNLNFNLGGKQVVGEFSENGAAVFIAELERAQMVAL